MFEQIEQSVFESFWIFQEKSHHQWFFFRVLRYKNLLIEKYFKLNSTSGHVQHNRIQMNFFSRK